MMNIDILGDLFGKARRRKLEAAAAQVLTGGQKPVAVDYGVLGTKFATAATLYFLNGTLSHTLPATSGGILTGVSAALVAAGPSALQSSGLFNALSPYTVSAIKGLGRTASAVLSAPANAKKAAFQAAVADEVQNVLEKTGQFTAGTASGNLASPPVPGSGAGSVATPAPQSPAETPTGGQSALSAAGTDAAIALVGGNQ